MRDENCIFCKIANGEIPSNKLYEDEAVVAILDAAPATKGHTLVIPKKHHDDLFDMTPEEAGEIMQRARTVAAMLKKALSPDGMNMMQNNGEVAGQTVLPYPLHLIPRYLTDPKQINWKPGPADTEKLKEIHAEIMRKV